LREPTCYMVRLDDAINESECSASQNLAKQDIRTLLQKLPHTDDEVEKIIVDIKHLLPYMQTCEVDEETYERVMNWRHAAADAI
jgi:hypothetical protein